MKVPGWGLGMDLFEEGTVSKAKKEQIDAKS